MCSPLALHPTAVPRSSAPLSSLWYCCLHTAWILTHGQMQVIEVLVSVLTSCSLPCLLLPAACLHTAGLSNRWANAGHRGAGVSAHILLTITCLLLAAACFHTAWISTNGFCRSSRCWRQALTVYYLLFTAYTLLTFQTMAASGHRGAGVGGLHPRAAVHPCGLAQRRLEDEAGTG